MHRNPIALKRVSPRNAVTPFPMDNIIAQFVDVLVAKGGSMQNDRMRYERSIITSFERRSMRSGFVIEWIDINITSKYRKLTVFCLFHFKIMGGYRVKFYKIAETNVVVHTSEDLDATSQIALVGRKEAWLFSSNRTDYHGIDKCG